MLTNPTELGGQVRYGWCVLAENHTALWPNLQVKLDLQVRSKYGNGGSA